MSDAHDPSVSEPPAVPLYPIALGEYRDRTKHTSFDADTEAAGIVAALASLLGNKAMVWDVAPDERHVGEVEARLSQLANHTHEPTGLVWVGHGRSNDKDAALFVPGVRTSESDEEFLPSQLGTRLAAQARRRAAQDPPAWTLVVVEACGAGRFVELVEAHLKAEGGVHGVALIGIGDPAGSGYTASAGPILREVVESFDPNHTIIRLNDLLAEVDERLGGCAGLVGSCGVAGCVIERPQIVLSATLDVYMQLRQALDGLPADVRSHFARKGMGSDFGELAWAFVGRASERERIVEHLHQGSGLLAVTGPAGSGKSAVLGNVLVRAQPELRDVLVRAGFLDEAPPSLEETALHVDAWLHLNGRTSWEVVEQLAITAGVTWSESSLKGGEAASERRLLEALLAAQRGRVGPLSVVADALDESRDPEAIADALRQLAEAGACIVVGTRPSLLESVDHPAPDARHLLDQLGTKAPNELWVRRDPTALRTYLERGFASQLPTLAPNVQARVIDVLCGTEAGQPTSPADNGRGFLYARLLLHELKTRPDLDDRNLTLLLAGNHRTIFATAMERLRAEHPVTADLLEALTHRQGNGLPRVGSVWATIASRLSGRTPPSAADIDQALELGAPYIAIGAEQGQAVYRLAHQTFQEYFQDTHTAESALQVSAGLIELAHRTTPDLNPYLMAHLAGHVGRAGQPGWEQLTEHEAILDHIEPASVTHELMRTAFGQITIPPQLSGLLASGRVLSDCAPEDRQGLRQLSTAWFTSTNLAASNPGTWSVISAARHRRAPHLTLTGHTRGVWAVTSFTTGGGRVLLATASDDETVRVWDPGCPDAVHRLGLHTPVTSLAALPDGTLIVGLSDGWARIQLPANASKTR